MNAIRFHRTGGPALRGMMVLFGASSGPVPPLDPQILNRKGSLFLTRPTLGHYVATRDELLACKQAPGLGSRRHLAGANWPNVPADTCRGRTSRAGSATDDGKAILVPEALRTQPGRR